MPLSVASWNVLATSYVRPDLYGECDPAAIEPTARRSRVVELAAGLDADVVCLQEVEQDQFDALVKRFSDTHECGFGRKGGDKPDGCAIFVRQSRRFARSGGLQRYADGSGHMFSWMFAELGGRPVGIATTRWAWMDALAQRKQTYQRLRKERELTRVRTQSEVELLSCLGAVREAMEARAQGLRDRTSRGGAMAASRLARAASAVQATAGACGAACARSSGPRAPGRRGRSGPGPRTRPAAGRRARLHRSDRRGSGRARVR